MSSTAREIRNALIVAIGALSLVAPAAAQAPCDCTVKVPGCTGHSTYSGGKIRTTASTNQCAMVTYRVNGMTQSPVIVKGGYEEEDFTSIGTPVVDDEDCVICQPADARGVKIDPHPTGRTNPNMNEIRQDTLKLLRKGS
jgi:hypothetical protein